MEIHKKSDETATQDLSRLNITTGTKNNSAEESQCAVRVSQVHRSVDYAAGQGPKPTSNQTTPGAIKVNENMPANYSQEHFQEDRSMEQIPMNLTRGNVPDHIFQSEESHSTVKKRKGSMGQQTTSSAAKKRCDSRNLASSKNRSKNSDLTFALKPTISVSRKEKQVADLKQSSTESPSVQAMNPLFNLQHSSNNMLYDGASIAGSELTGRSISTGIRNIGKNYIMVNTHASAQNSLLAGSQLLTAQVSTQHKAVAPNANYRCLAVTDYKDLMGKNKARAQPRQPRAVRSKARTKNRKTKESRIATLLQAEPASLITPKNRKQQEVIYQKATAVVDPRELAQPQKPPGEIKYPIFNVFNIQTNNAHDGTSISMSSGHDYLKQAMSPSFDKRSTLRSAKSSGRMRIKKTIEEEVTLMPKNAGQLNSLGSQLNSLGSQPRQRLITMSPQSDDAPKQATQATLPQQLESMRMSNHLSQHSILSAKTQEMDKTLEDIKNADAGKYVRVQDTNVTPQNAAAIRKAGKSTGTLMTKGRSKSAKQVGIFSQANFHHQVGQKQSDSKFFVISKKKQRIAVSYAKLLSIAKGLQQNILPKTHTHLNEIYEQRLKSYLDLKAVHGEDAQTIVDTIFEDIKTGDKELQQLQHDAKERRQQGQINDDARRTRRVLENQPYFQDNNTLLDSISIALSRTQSNNLGMVPVKEFQIELPAKKKKVVDGDFLLTHKYIGKKINEKAEINELIHQALLQEERRLFHEQQTRQRLTNFTDSKMEGTATQGHGSPKQGDHDKLLRNYENLCVDSELIHKSELGQESTNKKYNIVVGADRRTTLVKSHAMSSKEKGFDKEGMGGRESDVHNISPDTLGKSNMDPYNYVTTTQPDHTESPGILSKSFVEKNGIDARHKNEITIFDQQRVLPSAQQKYSDSNLAKGTSAGPTEAAKKRKAKRHAREEEFKKKLEEEMKEENMAKRAVVVQEKSDNRQSVSQAETHLDGELHKNSSVRLKAHWDHTNSKKKLDGASTEKEYHSDGDNRCPPTNYSCEYLDEEDNFQLRQVPKIIQSKTERAPNTIEQPKFTVSKINRDLYKKIKPASGDDLTKILANRVEFQPNMNANDRANMPRIATNPIKPIEYHIHLPSDEAASPPERCSGPVISKRKSLTVISKTGSGDKNAQAHFTVALSRSTSPRNTMNTNPSFHRGKHGSLPTSQMLESQINRASATEIMQQESQPRLAGKGSPLSDRTSEAGVETAQLKTSRIDDNITEFKSQVEPPKKTQKKREPSYQPVRLSRQYKNDMRYSQPVSNLNEFLAEKTQEAKAIIAGNNHHHQIQPQINLFSSSQGSHDQRGALIQLQTSSREQLNDDIRVVQYTPGKGKHEVFSKQPMQNDMFGSTQLQDTESVHRSHDNVPIQVQIQIDIDQKIEKSQKDSTAPASARGVTSIKSKLDGMSPRYIQKPRFSGMQGKDVLMNLQEVPSVTGAIISDERLVEKPLSQDNLFEQHHHNSQHHPSSAHQQYHTSSDHNRKPSSPATSNHGPWAQPPHASFLGSDFNSGKTYPEVYSAGGALSGEVPGADHGCQARFEEPICSSSHMLSSLSSLDQVRQMQRLNQVLMQWTRQLAAVKNPFQQKKELLPTKQFEIMPAAKTKSQKSFKRVQSPKHYGINAQFQQPSFKESYAYTKNTERRVSRRPKSMVPNRRAPTEEAAPDDALQEQKMLWELIMKNLDPTSDDGGDVDLDQIQKLLALLNRANAEELSEGMTVRNDGYRHPVQEVNHASKELVWRAIQNITRKLASADPEAYLEMEQLLLGQQGHPEIQIDMLEEATNKDAQEYDTLGQITHKGRVVLTSHCSVVPQERNTQGTAINLPSYDDEDDEEIDPDVKDLRKPREQTLTPLLEMKAHSGQPTITRKDSDSSETSQKQMDHLIRPQTTNGKDMVVRQPIPIQSQMPSVGSTKSLVALNPKEQHPPLVKKQSTLYGKQSTITHQKYRNPTDSVNSPGQTITPSEAEQLRINNDSNQTKRTVVHQHQSTRKEGTDSSVEADKLEDHQQVTITSNENEESEEDDFVESAFKRRIASTKHSEPLTQLSPHMAHREDMMPVQINGQVMTPAGGEEVRQINAPFVEQISYLPQNQTRTRARLLENCGGTLRSNQIQFQSNTVVGARAVPNNILTNTASEAFMRQRQAQSGIMTKRQSRGIVKGKMPEARKRPFTSSGAGTAPKLTMQTTDSHQKSSLVQLSANRQRGGGAGNFTIIHPTSPAANSRVMSGKSSKEKLSLQVTGTAKSHKAKGNQGSARNFYLSAHAGSQRQKHFSIVPGYDLYQQVVTPILSHEHNLMDAQNSPSDQSEPRYSARFQQAVTDNLQKHGANPVLVPRIARRNKDLRQTSSRSRLARCLKHIDFSKEPILSNQDLHIVNNSSYLQVHDVDPYTYPETQMLSHTGSGRHLEGGVTQSGSKFSTTTVPLRQSNPNPYQGRIHSLAHSLTATMRQGRSPEVRGSQVRLSTNSNLQQHPAAASPNRVDQFEQMQDENLQLLGTSATLKRRYACSQRNMAGLRGSAASPQQALFILNQKERQMMMASDKSIIDTVANEGADDEFCQAGANIKLTSNFSKNASKTGVGPAVIQGMMQSASQDQQIDNGDVVIPTTRSTLPVQLLPARTSSLGKKKRSSEKAGKRSDTNSAIRSSKLLDVKNKDLT